MTYLLLVTGERDWKVRACVELALNEQLNLARELGEELVVMHGACETGADKFAELWCLENGVLSNRYPADFHLFGPSAGPIRNGVMVAKKPRYFLAFWSGRVNKSGTFDCIKQAVAAGVDGRVVARRKNG